ncbi:hypothetical protein [Dyella amyloliquefaciens]|uniref:hypothetical protein n=1 Tax=Dyella amyloliquefaciens TaxID=1770545 RepID=UPI0013EE89B5|nr:hypothetical protein [Dyella amyloliquefaciens]
MTTVSQPPTARHLRAADAALMRWYPRASLGLIHRVRARRPGYPLIDGGKGRAAA